MARGSNIRMWRRTIIMLATVLVLGFGLVLYSLVRVQLVDGAELRQMAIDQSLRNTTLTAKRGTIYDANGKVLAKSASVWTVILEPAYIKDDATREKIAAGLSEILGLEYDTVLEKTKLNSYYTYLKREVEEDVREKILTFLTENEISRGVILEDAYKRYYPYGTLASTVLGFTGTDHQGLAGLEAQYDKQLSGTAGRLVSAKNAIGTDMPFEYEQKIDAQDGYDLVLSLDETVQGVLEKYLYEGLLDNEVQNGAAAIVMNVNTGGIVGMAVKQDYDPNNPFTLTDQTKAEELKKITDDDEYLTALNEALQAQWRNKAVSDTYVPGSVFKMVTASIGLEEGIITENTTYTCTGSFSLGNGIQPMHCWKAGGHGTQTFTEGLCNSCNPFFIYIGQKIGASTFYKYFEAFGFTQKTGIDLPGESGSVYFREEDLNVTELATLSFGQNFVITPIQMVTACAAIVNGGYLVTPHVVEKIMDANGNVIKNVGTEVKRQVISEDVSKRMCAILQRNAEVGTAKNGYVIGFRVGGKTGTSEKVAEHQANPEEEMQYVASYSGFAPADDPQYALIVIYDEPQSDNYYGSAVAGPVFAKIMNEILPYLDVEREYTEEELQNLQVETPSVVGLSAAEAKTAVEGKSLSAKVIGSGETVVAQIPEAGDSVPKDGTVVLYTEESKLQKTVTVPDFSGKSLYEVNSLANEKGLQIILSGAGLRSSNVIAHSQSVAAGTETYEGAVITVTFIELDQVE